MAKKKSGKIPKKSTPSTNKPSRGFGDTVEKFTTATGIKKVVKWLANGNDCGCDARRDHLNKMFPYNKPECLMEDEYAFLQKYFTENNSQVTIESQHRMIEIYNRVFHDKAEPTGCSSCFRNNVHNKLLKVYNQYEKENE